MTVATSIVGVGLVFVMALIFMVLGFNFRKVLKVGCFAISAVLWFVTGALFPTIDETYAFIGWAFLMPAIFSGLLAAHGMYATYKHAVTEDWQNDEEGEEE